MELFHYANNNCKFSSDLTWNSLPFLIKNPDYVTCYFKMQNRWRMWKKKREQILFLGNVFPEVCSLHSCLGGGADLQVCSTMYSTLVEQPKTQVMHKVQIFFQDLPLVLVEARNGKKGEICLFKNDWKPVLDSVQIIEFTCNSLSRTHVKAGSHSAAHIPQQHCLFGSS